MPVLSRSVFLDACKFVYVCPRRVYICVSVPACVRPYKLQTACVFMCVCVHVCLCKQCAGECVQYVFLHVCVIYESV